MSYEKYNISYVGAFVYHRFVRPIMMIKPIIGTYLILKSRKIVKFNIGSAGINTDPSWFATDIDTLDITRRSNWMKVLLFRKFG